MNHSDCMREVGRLFAAFPQRTHSEATASVYIDALVGLQYAGALRDAVTDLIENERWLPPIALVREVYARHRQDHLPRALPEAEPSDSEVELSKSWWRAVNAHAAARGSEGHADEFAVCEHEVCVKARTSMPEPSDDN